MTIGAFLGTYCYRVSFGWYSACVGKGRLGLVSQVLSETKALVVCFLQMIPRRTIDARRPSCSSVWFCNRRTAQVEHPKERFMQNNTNTYLRVPSAERTSHCWRWARRADAGPTVATGWREGCGVRARSKPQRTRAGQRVRPPRRLGLAALEAAV